MKLAPPASVTKDAGGAVPRHPEVVGAVGCETQGASICKGDTEESRISGRKTKKHQESAMTQNIKRAQ